jgi:predicted transcriptional regulator
MPRRKAVAPLSHAEQRAVRVDAYVKDHLAKEREAGELKRQKLKALRTGEKASASERATGHAQESKEEGQANPALILFKGVAA